MRFSLILLLLPSTALGVTASSSCWNQGVDEAAACWQNIEEEANGEITAVAHATTDAMSNLLSETTQEESCDIPPPSSGRTTTKTTPMALKDVSLSLRWTCEMNRRLLRASQLSTSTHDAVPPSGSTGASAAAEHSIPMDVRGGTTTAVHVHPSQIWKPPIPATASKDMEAAPTTIFHAPSPVQRRGGVKRWGPDLLNYLQSVTTALGVQDNPLVLALSILFLDKACSVETHRGNHQACPYLLPRTIHRLLITSLWIATQSVYPEKPPAQLFAQLACSDGWKSLNIVPGDLQNMEDWMRKAMGSDGVSEISLCNFWNNWLQLFPSTSANASSGESRLKIRTRRKVANDQPQAPHHEMPQQPPTPSREQYQGEQNSYSMAADHSRDGVPSSPSGIADAALQCW